MLGRVLCLGWEWLHFVERCVAHLTVVARVEHGKHVVDVFDVHAGGTPVLVGAVAAGYTGVPLCASISCDDELNRIVNIALLLWLVANQFPTLVVDQYGHHFFAPRAVDIISHVGFQSLLGNLVASFKEELRIFATNEWYGELGLARIVQDEDQVFSWTFGSLALYAEVPCVVRTFVHHILDIGSRWSGHAFVIRVVQSGRSERDERVRSGRGVEHLIE